MKLDFTHVRRIGAVAVATGLGQLTFTIVLGFAILLLLGKSVMEAVYVAIGRAAADAGFFGTVRRAGTVAGSRCARQ